MKDDASRALTMAFESLGDEDIATAYDIVKEYRAFRASGGLEPFYPYCRADDLATQIERLIGEAVVDS